MGDSLKKILLLSDLNSAHTQRWAAAIAENGYCVKVVGLNPLEVPSLYYQHPLITTDSLRSTKSDGGRLAYILAIPKLGRIISQFAPNIVHAHYATSYGLMASLTKKTTLFLTLWGDDVLIFPKKSFFHKKLLQFNLSKADQLFAASPVLSKTSKMYSEKEVKVIPFGVNTDVFYPKNQEPEKKIVIGTVKGLEYIYGIDYLIRAFKIVKDNYQGDVSLLIVGSGSRASDFKKLVKELCIEESVTFAGKIDHVLTPDYHRKIDVFVALSRSESFGVAVVEAQSCAVPAVVTDVGGLPEVIENNVSGIVVESGNVEDAASAILALVKDENLRKKMGYEGRKRVNQYFNWSNNVEEMLKVYRRVIG